MPHVHSTPAFFFGKSAAVTCNMACLNTLLPARQLRLV